MHVQDQKHSNPKLAELKQLRKSKQRNIINKTSQLTFQVLKAPLAPQGGGEPKNYYPIVPPHDVCFVEKSYINITICMLTNISLVPIHMYMLCRDVTTGEW